MKRFVFLAILFMLAIVASSCSQSEPTASSTEKWVAYDSPDGYISAKFPSAPRYVPLYPTGQDAPPDYKSDYGYRIDLITRRNTGDVDPPAK